MLHIRSSKHIHLAQLKFCMFWLSSFYFLFPQPLTGASQVVLVIKNLPANVGDLRDTGLIPGSGRSLGGRHGNPIFLPGESHGQRKLTGVHRVPQSGTWLKRLAARARRASENNLSPLSYRQFDGWDVSREQHRNTYTIKGETNHQPRLDAWDKRSDLVLWEDLEGAGGEGGGRGDRDGEDM